jgi:hypothetical protein
VTASLAGTLLRHREPALLLDTVEVVGRDRLACTGRGTGPWAWPAMLEGAAQSAGLLAGLQPGGPGTGAVIAEYRDVVVHAAEHAGPLRFVARLDRRLLAFWRCRVEARSAEGSVLLEGLVTVAAGRPEAS